MRSRTDRLFRAIAPIAVGATAAAGLSLLGAGTASAEVTSTTFNNTCRATPSTSLAEATDQAQPATVTVDAPAAVSPGEEFDVTITPGEISFDNSQAAGGFSADVKEVSRLKIDVAMPDNATFISGQVVPGTSSGISGTQPTVTVVDENGNPDPDGSIIRLSGGNETIGNGPHSSASSSGGIKALAGDGAQTTFQLPTVRATLKAGDTGDVQLKLRTAGAAGQFNNDANFLTFLPKVNAPVVGTVWAPTRCTPRDSASAQLNEGAGPLATVEVERGVAETVTHLDGPSAVTNGGAFTLTATVVPTPEDGTVQFTRDGEDVGDPVEVVDGKASLTQTIDEDGDYSYGAQYSGAEFYEASSAGKTVSVTSEDIATTTAVVGPEQDAYRGEPVNLTAKVEPGVAGGEVTFVVDGDPVGAAEVKGDGVAVLAHTFDTDGTHRVIARYSGTDGVAASTSLQFPVSVTEAPAEDVATTITLDEVDTVDKGAAVTLTARLDPADAHGTVQFKLGDQALGGPVAVVDGVATLGTVLSSPGEFVITAEYSAGDGFVDSASDPVDVTVTGEPDTVPDAGGDGAGGAGSLDFGSLTDLLGGLG